LIKYTKNKSVHQVGFIYEADHFELLLEQS